MFGAKGQCIRIEGEGEGEEDGKWAIQAFQGYSPLIVQSGGVEVKQRDFSGAACGSLVFSKANTRLVGIKVFSPR
ncbi:hypothetical protein EMIT0P395_130182 [Pseudomonas sp. IT-P395]